MKREASRRVWGAITGCGCSLLFFALFAFVFGSSALVVVWAVLFG